MVNYLVEQKAGLDIQDNEGVSAFLLVTLFVWFHRAKSQLVAMITKILFS